MGFPTKDFLIGPDTRVLRHPDLKTLMYHFWEDKVMVVYPVRRKRKPLGAGGSTYAAGEEITSRREEPTSVAGEGDLSPESPPTPPSASQRRSIFRSSLARSFQVLCREQHNGPHS
ncbi:hypothetical protein TNCV_4929811 [Trichonephila clavipes]|nr:hypothetical protein TNCV_4929811 [Trichonephila clavipes]